MILAAYGTLRRGGRLEHYMGEPKYLGTEIVPGFDMFSLGSYPYIIQGNGSIKDQVRGCNGIFHA